MARSFALFCHALHAHYRLGSQQNDLVNWEIGSLQQLSSTFCGKVVTVDDPVSRKKNEITKIEFCLQCNLLIWFRFDLTNSIKEKFVIIKLTGTVYACMQASVS